MTMTDIQAWLDAEREYQRDKLAGAVADAMLTQEMPLALPGPILYRMVDRMLETGVRHGSDWASLEGANAIPAWISKGMAELDQEPSPVVEPQLPERGDFARAVTWADLNVT